MSQKKFSLSSPQREIWFDQILHEDITLYNRARYIKIPSIINSSLLEQAVNLLIKKHDTLRIHLTEEQGDDGTPLQTYVTDVNITVPLWDFSTEINPDEVAIAWMQKRADEPFLLIDNLLCRYDLIKTDQNSYYILMQYHHLIIDGFSMTLLSQSLAEIYTQLANEETPLLDSPSYTCFIDYDRTYIDSNSFDEQQRYWLSQYKTIPEPLLTPHYRSYYSDKLIGSDCHTSTMPRAFYQQLNEFAKQQRVSFFRVFLAILYVYFTQTGQRDNFSVGYSTLNRSKAEFKQIAGLFTLVSSSYFDFGRNLSFSKLLQKINLTLKENLAHQPFPNSEIKRWLNQKKGQQAAVLFDINVSYQRFDANTSFNGIDFETTILPNNWEQTPLTIYIQDFQSHSDIKFDFIYNCAYFEANEIKALQVSLFNLFTTIIKDSTTPICDLPILSKLEISKLEIGNTTTINYEANQNFIKLFEKQVQKNPDNIALVFEQNTLNYQQLNQHANQVAHYLVNLKNADGTNLLENNPFIVIAMERSSEMLITLLAILKVGGAYIPIDPHYPRARIRYMLDNSVSPLLLTQSHLKTQLPLADLKYPCLIQCLDEINFSEQSVLNLGKNISADDLAYVIYTSGSTGNPKGVMIQHDSLANFLQSMQKLIKITTEDKLLAVTTLSFDIAALELYLPLISGSCLYLATQEMANDAFVLQQQLETNNISIMQATPATWQLLKHSDWQAKKPLTILCGGEALPTELGNYLLENSKQLWNVYGPTETTVWSSSYQIKSTLTMQPSIGQPISNTRFYIIDKANQLLPIGITGELCIAGSGLSRGYLNQPELTAEKFIEIKLLGNNERIYKTGDLARWLPDGNLEYLGRIDHQIKLHGFRIELGEIETNLCVDADVKEAVVILHSGDNSSCLIAYITSDNKTLDLKGLQLSLKNSLPSYMIPAQIIILNSFPLTPNGKIDRKALPIPDAIYNSSPNKVDVLPSTITEEILAQIWVDILKIDSSTEFMGSTSINVHDDFFTMGGDSLFAVHIISQVQKIFQIKLPLRYLFDHPTIAELSKYIETQVKEKHLLSTEKNKNWSVLVPIQLAGNKKPIFIIPGLAASEEELINLIKLIYLLGKDQPVYGLQARGWDGVLPPYASVEEMAADCVQEIRKIQPQGSYLLVGECLGGRVMLEIAQQLQAQQQEIGLLVLMDTVLNTGGGDLISVIKNIIIPKLKTNWKNLSTMSADKLLPYIFNKSKRVIRILFPNIILENHLSNAEKMKLLQKVHVNMIRRYQPKIYTDDLTLFMTEKFYQKEPKLRWKSLSTAKVTLYQLPGEHQTYLGKEVETTAKLLKNCLAKVQNNHSS